MRQEAFFKEVSSYSANDVVRVARHLGLRLVRHATPGDARRALHKFVCCRRRLCQGVRQREVRAVQQASEDDWDGLPDEEELAACALLYSSMSLQHLKKECKERGLAENKLVSGRRVPQFKSGKLAKFRRMLAASDVAFAKHCPDTGFAHLSTIELRAICGSIGLSQGDQLQGTMLSSLGCFVRCQNACLHQVRSSSMHACL